MNAAESIEPRLPEPGDRIAERYIVESRLAVGGMGVVVVVRHELLDERFALKVLKPDLLGSPDVVTRFVREAQACVGLRSEHAVRVFDVGTLPSGLPFLVMELLDGHDLRRELEQRGALPVEEAATWIVQACHALAEAHARGIVHRDVKPGNLFLTTQPDGRRVVKVVDFGISKLLDEPASEGALAEGNPRLTQTVGLLGSPQYMSPEQVRSASRVDHRTDVWSLGCVLYELLTAVSPFGGESVSAVSAMIEGDEPTPLTDLRLGLPEGLVDAVTRCLCKDRERRVQSVAELASLLEPYAPGEPGASQRVLHILRSVPPSSGRSMRPLAREPETLANADTPATRLDPPRGRVVVPVSERARLAGGLVAAPGSAARSRRGPSLLVGLSAVAVVTVALVVGYELREPERVVKVSSAPTSAGVPTMGLSEALGAEREAAPRDLAAERRPTPPSVATTSVGPHALPVAPVNVTGSSPSTRSASRTPPPREAPNTKPYPASEEKPNDPLSDRR